MWRRAAGLHALCILPRQFNCTLPFMAQRHGRVGRAGYEINFYRCTPPRLLEAIEAGIRAIATSLD